LPEKTCQPNREREWFEREKLYAQGGNNKCEFTDRYRSWHSRRYWVLAQAAFRPVVSSAAVLTALTTRINIPIAHRIPLVSVPLRSTKRGSRIPGIACFTEIRE
jgi:hypothetical protein